MEWIAMVIVALGGICLGYTLCLGATWVRVNRQDSELRALINAIEVEKALNREVSTEWVLQYLEWMLHREFS